MVKYIARMNWLICAVIFLIGFLCIIVGDATAWTSPIVAIEFYA